MMVVTYQSRGGELLPTCVGLSDATDAALARVLGRDFDRQFRHFGIHRFNDGAATAVDV
jgi:hypothetical protein